jgi:hypothetical protein
VTAPVPAKPLAPITTLSLDDITVTWIEPDGYGYPLSGYIVSIRESDETTYTVDLTNCDMSSSTLTTCTIPITALLAAPYNLEWGSSVFAKVIAKNTFEQSEESSEGDGAFILTFPDEPTSVAEVEEDRTISTLSLTWTPPIFTGGGVIIDYRLSISKEGGAFSVLASEIISNSYTATDLITGITYEFKLESRNSIGYSSSSDVLNILFDLTLTACPVTEFINLYEKLSIDKFKVTIPLIDDTMSKNHEIPNLCN